MTKVSRADSARVAAVAYCQGTPLRSEIENRGMGLEEATDVVEQALNRRFGLGPIERKIRAHFFAVEASISGRGVD